MRMFQKMALILLTASAGLSMTAGRKTIVSLDRARPDLVQAEIKGEVNKPGVYQVKYQDTLDVLIAQAGGLSEEADASDISLVQEVEEGQVYVIGKKAEEGETEKISINTASLEQLMQLPGIGPAMAQRIVDWRKDNPFQSLEDLMEVKGIGEKTFEKLRELICL